MDEELDRDIKVQRASSYSIANLKKNIPRLLSPDLKRWSQPNQSRLFTKVIGWVDVFQEDPQLLDPYLHQFLYPIVDRYLQILRSSEFLQGEENPLKAAEGLSGILYFFCKVRGRKVISRFLFNEPKHVEPLLEAVQVLHQLNLQSEKRIEEDSSTQDSTVLSLRPSQNNWRQDFVLLLWLDHLMLTPFSLDSISSSDLNARFAKDYWSPESLPALAVNVLNIGLEALKSPTTKQVVAANLLTRLATRPDMRGKGLVNSLVESSLAALQNSDETDTVHESIGHLRVLSEILVSGESQWISQYVGRIFNLTIRTFSLNSENDKRMRFSAVAKKLAVKILRNVIIHLLQTQHSRIGLVSLTAEKVLGEMSALEDIIDSLLRSLADRDTQVRLAASKALSITAQNLNSDMAREVAEAIIGSLQEDVISQNGKRSFEAVNPIRWHGLTLTLSHLLFRQSIPPILLPNVLEALYSALQFEQRSATGSSIGGNVRDAANFGLWSLARRFSTHQLQQNHSDEQLDTHGENAASSTLQLIANKLVEAACLDPVGNVRRGSAAALQELVGRHPDTIQNGIALVQTVDYHAVGLRNRAMIDVAFSAAGLASNYRDALLEGLQGWRGICAQDASSRSNAGTAFGMLVNLLPLALRLGRIQFKVNEIKATEQIEERHGLQMALAGILHAYDIDCPKWDAYQPEEKLNLAATVRNIWDSLSASMGIDPRGTRSAQRLELAAAANLTLLARLSDLTSSINSLWERKIGGISIKDLSGPFSIRFESVDFTTVTLSLEHVNEKELIVARESVQALGKLLKSTLFVEVVNEWVKDLKQSTRLSRVPGLQIAVGAAWPLIFSNEREQLTENTSTLNIQIIRILSRNSEVDREIEVRVIALRSLECVLENLDTDLRSHREIQTQLTQILGEALNDYTTNERGDVGSLVRLEALKVLEEHWSLQGFDAQNEESMHCFLSTLRLSLEKLDKCRLRGASCLYSTGLWAEGRYELRTITDVSNQAHFRKLLSLLKDPIPHHFTCAGFQDVDILVAIVSGVASSTGSGSENIIELSRAALVNVLDTLPILDPSAAEKNSNFGTPCPSILAFGNAILRVLELSLAASLQHKDRLQLPLLEMIAYLLDMGILQRLPSSPRSTTRKQMDGQSMQHEPQTHFKYSTLLALVQKAQYKSTSLPKLLASLSVYRCLAAEPNRPDLEVSKSSDEVNRLCQEQASERVGPSKNVRKAALAKIASLMVNHPYVKVRTAATEAAWCVTGYEGLLSVGGEKIRNNAREQGINREDLVKAQEFMTQFDLGT